MFEDPWGQRSRSPGRLMLPQTIVCDSINRPGDLDLWPLNRFTGYATHVIGFHHANFGQPRPFELGWDTRQTVRRTDGQTHTGHHFIMPLPTEVGGVINLRTRTACRFTSICAPLSASWATAFCWLFSADRRASSQLDSEHSTSCNLALTRPTSSSNAVFCAAAFCTRSCDHRHHRLFTVSIEPRLVSQVKGKCRGTLF